MNKWQAIRLAVAFVLLLPILVPYAIWKDYQRLRILRNAARETPCPACGQSIGVSALNKADQAWKEYVSGLRRKYPGVRLRIQVMRNVDAICLNCGVSLKFRKSFEVTKPIGQAEAETDEKET